MLVNELAIELVNESKTESDIAFDKFKFEFFRFSIEVFKFDWVWVKII